MHSCNLFQDTGFKTKIQRISKLEFLKLEPARFVSIVCSLIITSKLYICAIHYCAELVFVDDLAKTRTRAGFSDFRLINFDTCIAVIPVQSSPSTLSNRSPTRT